jgi:hypothetical protein
MQIEYVVPLPVVSRFAFSVMDGLALNWLAMGDEDGAREVVHLTVQALSTMVRPRSQAPAGDEEARAGGPGTGVAS